MNKSEFIAAIAKKLDCTKAQAQKNLDAMLEAVQEALQDGQEIKLIGSGTFKKVRRPAKVVRNPQNGKQINVPASEQPKFYPGKGLKEAMNS